MPDEILFTLYHSTAKPVVERLKNYFGKYLQQIAEITPEEWASIPVPLNSPKYAKARDEFIGKRLDRRPKKIVEPPPEVPPPPPPQQAIAGRRGVR